ncbi:hypothetical protein E2C01_094874 [Portunus trituberculatus]|uniref:Uncharacterized protein n=1 Tax=Portunus trituberculatus TaxID=210409 RepID=A0A5B7JRM6_PORTR|nr:hypothetical protein [Portunus trituberculatus]
MVMSCGSVRCQATCVSKLPSGKMKLRSHSRGHVLSVAVRVCRQDAGSNKDEGCGKGGPVRRGTVRAGGGLGMCYGESWSVSGWGEE